MPCFHFARNVPFAKWTNVDAVPGDNASVFDTKKMPARTAVIYLAGARAAAHRRLEHFLGGLPSRQHFAGAAFVFCAAVAVACVSCCGLACESARWPSCVVGPPSVTLFRCGAGAVLALAFAPFWASVGARPLSLPCSLFSVWSVRALLLTDTCLARFAAGSACAACVVCVRGWVLASIGSACLFCVDCRRLLRDGMTSVVGRPASGSVLR